MGVRNPQNVDLLDPKGEVFEPHPLKSLTNTPFLPILRLKVDLLADFFLGGGGWLRA